jgi:hypothetical protein
VAISAFLFGSNTETKIKQLKEEKKCEPRHDKTNRMGLRPAWIQTSLLSVSLLVKELISEQHGS